MGLWQPPTEKIYMNRSPAARYLVWVSRERHAFKSTRNIPFNHKKLKNVNYLSISVNKYFISLSSFAVYIYHEKKNRRQMEFDQNIASFL